jgi:hypothetical protein
MVTWPWARKTHVDDTQTFQASGELDRADQYAYSEHADQLPSLQTNLVRKVEYSDANTRWLHTKANPFAAKHTYGLVDEIFWHTPYPFKYVDKASDDILTAEPVPGMDMVHEQWDAMDMFRHFKEALSQGGGVGSAWIVRLTETQFIVLNPANIHNDCFARDPKTLKITELWFKIPGSGFIKGRMERDRMEDMIVKAVIGKNAVEYSPNWDVTTPFGRSDLLQIWTTCIYTAANHYYATLFTKKGGIGSRIIMAPDSMSPTSRKKFKKEALKGLESELLELYYPKGLVQQGFDPAKIVQWQETRGAAPGFPETDAMLATGSPLPPSFTQGPASGALGGSAPVEDNKRINRFLQSYTNKIQNFVKEINRVFFDYEQTTEMIVPYFMDETDPLLAGKVDPETGEPLVEDDPEKEEEKGKKEAPPQKAHTRTHEVAFQRVASKSHAKQGIVVYKGNMMSSGFYEYEQMDWWTNTKSRVYEHLDGQEIKGFIDDPLSIKEVYLDIEHNQSVEVWKGNSVGKVVIKGYKEEAGVIKDVSEIQFKSEWDPKHDSIFLSPIYNVQMKDLGKTYHGEKALSQTNLSLVNCSLCHYPRSALTGLDTSAKRAE